MTKHAKQTVAGGLFAAGVLWACGPFFGLSLLLTRKESTLAAPAVSFYRALETLAPAPVPGLKSADRWGPSATDEEEKEKELAPRLVQIRSLTDSAKAWEAGEGLPEAVRLYTAGAVAFRARQFDEAQQRFAAVTALPAAASARRALWAEFMLGRLAAQREDRAAAIRHFAAVRESVARRQTPDPLGLAVASFGEEARMYWLSRELKPAVALYAQQAAYESESGRASLLEVAREILKDEKLLDQAVPDPLIRKLLLVYLAARSGEDAAPVTRLAGALERHRIADVTGLGLLAAASYAVGDFALAGRLAAREPDGAAAAWVRAKLALRGGNSDAARAEYATALQAARQPGAVEASRVAADAGLHMVSRGEYTQALELFLEAVDPAAVYMGGSDYWTDAAYLAERVLSVDELDRFIARRAPNTVKFEKKADEEWTTGPAPQRLRALLARRLMRAGRYDDAARHFDDAQVREAAAAYASAVQRAQSWWRPAVWRAEAWLTAGRLARKHGLEVLGYELAPDFAVYVGHYEWPGDDELQKDAPAAETRRAEASASPRAARFQYRLTAADHARQAASLVPARGAAFGPILCEAASWTIDRHPSTAAELYRRYVREGAFMPSLAQFGRRCPEPQFESGGWWRARTALRPVSRRLGFDVTLAAALLAGLGAAAVAAGGWWRWRAQ
ncbi:MAG: hypothetical protein IT162_02970 [Bryobacterales bacterium]|nr:hypothetical protein [Bryobacterales bacterium]